MMRAEGELLHSRRRAFAVTSLPPNGIDWVRHPE